MTISPSTRSWVESIDPENLSPYDRGQLRVLLGGKDRDEVLALLGQDGEQPTGSASFDRGFGAGRAAASPFNRSIDPTT